MNTFKNRNILITGATSGLGKELSTHLDQKAKRLICLGKTRTKSGESTATRRIISRFQELEKLELSVEDIMNKLLNE